ncbi:hypothetical protein GCM10027578_40340 [Spirosoma luteolum]
MYRLLLFLLTASAVAQTPDLISLPPITDPVHRAHVGRIVFTPVAIPAADLSDSVQLTTYELTNKSNLFMTVFMGTSLTNYLHRLAPELPADTLTRVGGYQFNFYVDNRLVYQSNLHPGAPYASVKNRETIISKPLIDNQKEGAWWSQSAWNRFMQHGGDSALTDGPHLFRLQIRPYLNWGGLRVGEPIATGTLALRVNRKPIIDPATIQLNHPAPYPGFAVSRADFDTNRIKTLKGAIEAGMFKHITGVVVIKNGELLIEEYANGATRDSLHDVRSVGKSFAAALTGIALHDRYLKRINQPLSAFYSLQHVANPSATKAKITVRELLTMSSSFDGDDDDSDSPGNEENMYPTPDWIRFILNLPVNPGRFGGAWHYFTAGVVLLGDILDQVVPNGLERYAHQQLFEPLGIRTYRWTYTPQQRVSLAGGIRMNALDFAKFGQLYKNGGRWNNRPIMPAAWVSQTFTRHKAIPGRAGEYYGYLFWNKTYQVGSKACETYYSAGNGGNKIFVFTNQPLVVVVTATAYGTPYAHRQVDQLMEQYVLPAVLD